jgi:ABC-type nitrate/sulfonate/bicarbonate transport system substrate-binding protein
MRLKKTCALALAFTLVAGGCADTTATGGAGPAGGREISVAVSGGDNPAFAPYLIARAQGYFADRGIKIKHDVYASGTLSFSAFAGGGADLCICGSTQVMTAGQQGRDVLAVFNLFIGGAVVFVGAKKHEQSKGTDLAKYAGATWAYTAEGSVSQVFMARAASAKGLSWNKQKHLAVGAVNAFVPSLRSGRADIVAMDVTSAAQAIALGVGYPVFNTNDPATVESIWGEQLGLPLVTTKAFAAKNPDLTQKMVDAMRQGLMDVQRDAGDDKKILSLMPPNFQTANRANFPQIWTLVRPAFSKLDGTFTEKQLADTKNLAVATNVLGAGTDVHGYFDNKYAKSALGTVKARP